MELGRFIDVRLIQSKKAAIPIEVIVLGRLKDTKLESPQKA